jgi:hypothetical protein
MTCRGAYVPHRGMSNILDGVLEPTDMLRRRDQHSVDHTLSGRMRPADQRDNGNDRTSALNAFRAERA